MTAKKILYIHHSIGMGGAPTSLATLIAGLNRSEFTPFVLMPARPNNENIKNLFIDAGAQVIEERDIRPFNGVNGCRCDGLKNRAYAILGALPTWWAVRKHVSKLQPDVVHVNTIVLPFAAAGSRWANASIPTVTHIRETVLQNRWGKMLAWLNRRYTDFFIGIDQSGIDSIGVSEDRSAVVHNFVDRSQFRSDPELANQTRKQYGWEKDQVVFLSLSRVTSSNGALELARLIAKCEAELDPSALFVVAGFHQQQAEYAESAKRELESSHRCRTIPFTDDVISLINAADVIIAPFISAHSSRSVFEGAAMGKPALVTDFPNLKELIVDRETGFTFDFDNQQSFVDSVNQLCQLEIRSTMNEAAFEFAAENFDAKRNTEKTMQTYRRVLANT